MIAKNPKTKTCSIVLDYPERHILIIGCNGFVCKLCRSFMERKCDNPAILLLMHYLLLWNGLYINHVKCLYDGATCMTTVLTVYQSKLTWDRHQGLDLGVQTHIFLFLMNSNRTWNILNWNVRGINSSDKWLAIKQKVEESAGGIVCLQEQRGRSLI